MRFTQIAVVYPVLRLSSGPYPIKGSSAITGFTVGNELVHAGSHARPQAVDRGMPSQGGSTE